MSASRILLAGLALNCALALTAQAASATLNLRPGLWEMTTSGEASGAPPIPEELLARLPPERRAKLQAAMAASMARAGAPHASKQCITRQSLQRGIKIDDSGERNCHPTVISSTASVMDMRIECKSAKQAASGTIHFQTAGPEAVNGTVHMAIGNGDHRMAMKRVISGKWLGADCGGVKSAGN
ncbi:MAG: DUF3617 domain-containing protein [Pseudolabrys sp.]